jgi:hypothetical protein
MEEREEEKLLKNTIDEERFQISKVARRLGPKLSGLMITCGLLILVFGVYLMFEPPDPVLSGRLNIVFTGALGFIGGLNFSCGLLLLLGEL